MSSQYLPSAFFVKINGTDISLDFREDIVQVIVEESLHLPSLCTLVISNSYFPGRIKDEVWSISKEGGTPSPSNKSGVGGSGKSLEELIKIGSTIQVGFSASTTASFDDADKDPSLFKGEITAIETHFTQEAQAPIVVRSYDPSHRLHRGQFNRSFLNVTDSDVVNQIIQEVGLSIGKVESTQHVHEYLFQQNQTNMEFIRERAARNGFEVYARNGKFYFCQPHSPTEVVLRWLVDISSFRVRANTSEQVQEVNVLGWDIKTKKKILGQETSSNVLTITDQGSGPQKTAKYFPGAKKVFVVDKPILSQQEANKIAKSLFNELSGEFVVADASGTGNPSIRAGRVATLTNLSSESGENAAIRTMGPFDGKYYITECRHVWRAGVYTTEFSVRGSRGGNLLNVLSPKQSLNPSQTILVGIVTNNNDPQGWGRVKVRFPTLTEEHESQWARLVTLGAGGSRGIDWLPEINDEVMVAFEHGDIHRPYVVGSVWNGVDKPSITPKQALQGNKVNLRTLQTRVGHKIQFIEEDKESDKKGILIETKGGHKIQIRDVEKLIELKTQGGHSVKLNDQDKTIQIRSSSGHQITLADQGSKVTISSTNGHQLEFSPSGVSLSSAGNLVIKANGNIDIQAQANLNISANLRVGVKGSMINLN